jgi:hypothetical protein
MGAPFRSHVRQALGAVLPNLAAPLWLVPVHRQQQGSVGWFCTLPSHQLLGNHPGQGRRTLPGRLLAAGELNHPIARSKWGAAREADFAEPPPQGLRALDPPAA